MTLTGQTKSATTLTAQGKNATVLLGVKKSGNGWDYDQADITYDGLIDSEGREVFYDGLGQATVLTALPKHAA